MADNKDSQVLNVAGSITGLGLVGLLWFATWALVFQKIPQENQTNFSTLMGIISMNVGLVVGFFFGSSVNNKKQSETISTMAKTQASLLPDPEDKT